MISSLLTLLVRQRVSPLGLLLSRAAVDQVLAAQQQARRLRPAQALAARERRPGRTPSWCTARGSRPAGRRRRRRSASGCCAVLPIATNSSWWIFPWGSAKLRKNIIAVRSLIAFSSSSRVSTSIMRHARVADRVVVADAVRPLDDDLVLHARGVRQAADPLAVAPGDAGRRGQRERRGTARGHQRRRAVEQLGDPLADGRRAGRPASRTSARRPASPPRPRAASAIR